MCRDNEKIQIKNNTKSMIKHLLIMYTLLFSILILYLQVTNIFIDKNNFGKVISFEIMNNFALFFISPILILFIVLSLVLLFNKKCNEKVLSIVLLSLYLLELILSIIGIIYHNKTVYMMMHSLLGLILDLIYIIRYVMGANKNYRVDTDDGSVDDEQEKTNKNFKKLKYTLSIYNIFIIFLSFVGILVASFMIDREAFYYMGKKEAYFHSRAIIFSIFFLISLSLSAIIINRTKHENDISLLNITLLILNLMYLIQFTYGVYIQIKIDYQRDFILGVTAMFILLYVPSIIMSSIQLVDDVKKSR